MERKLNTTASKLGEIIILFKIRLSYQALGNGAAIAVTMAVTTKYQNVSPTSSNKEYLELNL